MTKKIEMSLALLMAIALSTEQVLACTTIIVGSEASESGAVIIARDEDFFQNNWAKHMVVRQASVHEDGATWEFNSGLSVPKPASTLRYTAMPDWNADMAGTGSGPFEEAGVNSANVAVTATESAQGNDKSQQADPFVDVGIDESVIPTLLLSQATSAREAVELLGDYVDEFGAMEGNALSIADINEAWLFEIGSGHHWIAVKVPNDVYMVQANSLQVHDVDLTDSENVVHSEGLVAHVTDNGLLEQINENSFDFARAFGVLGDTYNVDRVWLCQHKLSPSVTQPVRMDIYPLFMEPDEKIGVLEIAAGMRADYAGTELDGIAERNIGVDRNLETHIIEMRSDVPPEIAGVIWQSIGNVTDSLFIPIYAAITETPEAYQIGTDEFDTESAYWRFRGISTLLDFAPDEFRTSLRETRDQTEERLVLSLPHVDAAISEMLEQDRDLGIWFANAYSNGMALKALERATQIRNELLTQLTKSTESDYDPAEWIKINQF